MIRKLLLVAGLLALAAMAYLAWLLHGPATRFSEEKKILYIRPGKTSRQQVLETLREGSYLLRPVLFDRMARYKNYWENVKPGRYEIKKGSSVMELVYQLKNGRQSPLNMVVGKMRTLPDLGRTITRYIESDSATVMRFLNNADSMQALGLTPQNWMAQMVPNTYEIWWTSTTGEVLRRLKKEKEDWWNKSDRKAKATALGLSPEQVITLASIVEEETNRPEDKGTVASVYINRLRVGMPLQADPTVRFAIKDFVSNRVLYSHLRTPSPYNTYLNRGLPPGPICTPSAATVDAVLQAPKTDYLYFVAHPNLEGGSVFTTNLSDHSKAARQYQDSLTAWLKRKAAKARADSNTAK